MTLGLGVVVDGKARFYPMSELQSGVPDELANQKLRVTLSQTDGVPQAPWPDGTCPIQYLLRWYGLALTYPNGSIYPSKHET